jgi:hypothetical protein
MTIGARNGGCGICGGYACYDPTLDMNVCLICGAHENVSGWEARGVPYSSIGFHASRPNVPLSADELKARLERHFGTSDDEADHGKDQH